MVARRCEDEAMALASAASVFYETMADDGGVATLQVEAGNVPFDILDLQYPVRVITQDADGIEMGSRVLETDDDAIEDDVLLAAELRSGLLHMQQTDSSEFRFVVNRTQVMIDDPETLEEDRQFLIASIRGLGS